MTSDWRDLTEWWLAEIVHDRAYREEVLPLLLDLLEPGPGSRFLDLGCGEGQGMHAVARSGGRVIGCDFSPELLERAASRGPVVLCRLPELGWVRAASFDGAYAALVIEHLEHPAELFAGAASAVRTGGSLVLVSNHPLFTAPGSGPVLDPTDGELFWRWGTYLDPGHTDEPAGEATVRFHHRPLALLLNAAAKAGWVLERMVERGTGSREDPLLGAQAHIPRLLGVRWVKA